MLRYRRKLFKLGNSLVVTIPKDALRYQGKNADGFFFFDVLSENEKPR